MNLPNLHLYGLTEQRLALTPATGAYIAECASVCLEDCGHLSGCNLEVRGLRHASFGLLWTPATDQMRRSHNDEELATENGAYGIAILIVAELTPYQAIERSRKGTGFDYWLGVQGDQLFQRKAASRSPAYDQEPNQGFDHE